MIPKGERQGEKKDRIVSSQPPRVFRISFHVLCKYSVSYPDQLLYPSEQRRLGTERDLGEFPDKLDR